MIRHKDCCFIRLASLGKQRARPFDRRKRCGMLVNPVLKIHACQSEARSFVRALRNRARVCSHNKATEFVRRLPATR